jgi:amino acid permease
MLKSQIGIGVLSIPSAFDVLGMVPGVILLLFIATVATWSGLVVGPFKRRHPHVYGLDDAGYMMGGPIAREVMAGGFTLCKLIVRSLRHTDADNVSQTGSSFPARVC